MPNSNCVWSIQATSNENEIELEHSISLSEGDQVRMDFDYIFLKKNFNLFFCICVCVCKFLENKKISFLDDEKTAYFVQSDIESSSSSKLILSKGNDKN